MDHDTINGIDYLEVRTIPKNKIYPNPLILIHCFKTVPDSIGLDNIIINGGVRIKGITPQWIRKANTINFPPYVLISQEEADQVIRSIKRPENTIVIRSSSAGDFSTYTLQIIDSASNVLHFDPMLSEVNFSLKVECPSEFDCTCRDPPVEDLPEPSIDYMAKDYSSFRKLILDRLSLLMPEWKERNPADIGIAIVELLAYVGDHLSYYQDAVSTESYIGSARKRVSVSRHARLIDYTVSNGCNARVWICFQVDHLTTLAKGTQLMTKDDWGDDHGGKHFSQESISGVEIFETMYETTLHPTKGVLSFYTWSETDCWLPAGSTSATIDGRKLEAIEVFSWEDVPGTDTEKMISYLESNFGLDRTRIASVTKSGGDTLTLSHGDEIFTIKLDALSGKAVLSINGESMYEFKITQHAGKHHVKASSLLTGDVLVFAELELQADEKRLGDQKNRHAIRVKSVTTKIDPLTGTEVLGITWGQEDAMPFRLCLSRGGKPASIIYGNSVLADHGSSQEETLEKRVEGGKYYPKLQRKPLTWAGPKFDAKENKAALSSASSAFNYAPEEVKPYITLIGGNNFLEWESDRDIISNNEFARLFAVETSEDGTSYIRLDEARRKAFSDQILRGKFVGFTAKYRVGNGSRGNVGAESITRLISNQPGIVVTNPMPATGGQDPETTESIRLHAPQAFRKQERAVTEADYNDILKRHPFVQRAAATKRWTGSWYTMFIAVDRVNGQQVDAKFKNEILDYLEKYRLAGYDIEIHSPIYVPLNLSLEICLKEGYVKAEVQDRLFEAFSNKRVRNRIGLFHPDNFTFGQPLYLSKVYEVAMGVEGVLSVVAKRFQRWAKKSQNELNEGLIKIGPTEIIRLDNDPSYAENGIISFTFCSGERRR